MGFHVSALNREQQERHITEQEDEEEQPAESLYVTSPVSSDSSHSSGEHSSGDQDHIDKDFPTKVKINAEKICTTSSDPDFHKPIEPQKKSPHRKKDFKEHLKHGLTPNFTSDVSTVKLKLMLCFSH